MHENWESGGRQELIDRGAVTRSIDRLTTAVRMLQRALEKLAYVDSELEREHVCVLSVYLNDALDDIEYGMLYAKSVRCEMLIGLGCQTFRRGQTN